MEVTANQIIEMSAEVVGSLSDDTVSALQKLGLGSLSSPMVVTGKSGVRHTFTFGFGDPQTPDIACDVVIGSKPIDETKVLSLFIKVYDVGAKHAVLCTVPSMTSEAKKLSSLYKIVIVEVPDKDKVPSMVSEVLRRLAKSD